MQLKVESSNVTATIGEYEENVFTWRETTSNQLASNFPVSTQIYAGF